MFSQYFSRLIAWVAFPLLILISIYVLLHYEREKGDELPFTLPAGFTAELVAGPPLVNHPMFAGFDDRGRLLIADSAGTNPTAEQLQKRPPHFIRMLEDTDGDGRFDRSTVFAEGMHYPQGVLCHRGGVYVACPPSLWRLEDTDGDGVADKREEILTGFPLTGHADDFHGPFLGPEGRLYCTISHYDHATICRPGGPALLEGCGALILRCRPDGTEVEKYCGGVGNPVEVAHTAEGEPIVTGTYAMPGNSRDALFHGVYGGIYPIRDRNATEMPGVRSTGAPLPLLVRPGTVAPCGLMRYRSGAFGPQFKDNCFAAYYSAHSVQRLIMSREGATFRARTEDFIVGTHPDFFPTDVLEDADGSLLVVDTGKWFGFCSSHSSRFKVRGGIYRIRRTDPKVTPDARGRKIDWRKTSPQALTGLLADPRFVVRDRAVEELGQRGKAAVGALRETLRNEKTALGRRNALWALARIEGAAARAASRAALNDTEDSVRLTAIQGAGLHRDTQALEILAQRARSDRPALRREAATALGRLHQSAAVAPLLDGLRAGVADRFLEHALIFGLIESADPQAVRAGLGDASPLVRKAAVIALDQMEAGNLTEAEVAPLLTAQHPELRDAVVAILLKHPDWTRNIVRLLNEGLGDQAIDAGKQATLRGALPVFCEDAEVQQMVVHALRNQQTPVRTRLLLLETIGHCKQENVPPCWISELGQSLENADERVVRQAILSLRRLGERSFDARLLRLAEDRKRSEDLRLDALATLASRHPEAPLDLFRFLLECLQAEKPPLLRMNAAATLGRLQLNDDQLMTLAATMASVGPLELPRLLPAYRDKTQAEVGKRLIEALAQSPGLRSITAQSLREVLRSFPAEVVDQSRPLLVSLETEKAASSTSLAEFESALAGGDANRGRAVFFGSRTACSTCHRVEGNGGQVGPDLSRIGTTRGSRDLLEAIVYPSASFARGYEPYTVTTQDGRQFYGIIAHEANDAIHLVTGVQPELTIDRSAIEAIVPGQVSLMPQGLERQMSRQQLADLIAFLKSQR